MIETRFRRLERGGHVEDLLAVLNGDHTAIGEAMPIEAAVDLVNDRRVVVAAPQEIGVQRVHHARLHRGGCGRQCLAEHLAAEHLRTADVAARAAEQVELEPLELEQLEQVLEALIHGQGLQPNLKVPRIRAL